MQKIWKGEHIREERQEKKFLWNVMAKFPGLQETKKKGKGNCSTYPQINNDAALKPL